MGTEKEGWEDRRLLYFEDELYEVLLDDDKDKFLGLMEEDPLGKPKIFPPGYLQYVIFCGAVNCATALLNGETNQEVMLNDPCPRYHLTALHHASLSSNLKSDQMVQLLLRHNAQTDLRCNDETQYCHLMLPLNIILYNLRKSFYLKTWTPNQSIFKLICCVCQPSLRCWIEIARLLALSTKEFEEETFHYAKEGKLVELTILLLVAREKVLSPNFFLKVFPDLFGSHNSSELEGSMTLRNFIHSQLTSLMVRHVEPIYGSDSSKLARMYNEKQALMMSTLLLLEVFERAGDDIEAYLRLQKNKVPAEQVAKEVAKILYNVGFSLKYEDFDISYLERVRCQRMEASWHEPLLANSLNDKHRSRQHDLRMLKASLGSFQPCGKWGKEAMMYSSSTSRGASDASENVLACGLPYAEWRMPPEYLHESRDVALQSFKKLQHFKTVFSCDELTCYTSPLYGALLSLCHHPCLDYWNPKKSIFQLLCILCFPELKELIERIRSDVWKTENIDVMFFSYVKEGNLIEMAVLLIVARKELMPLITSQSEYGMVRRYIMSEIHQMIDKEIRLIGRKGYKTLSNKLARICKDKKAIMLSMLQLLELFEKGGDSIDQYLQFERCSEKTRETVVKDITKLLRKVGFGFKQKQTFLNDLQCSSNHLRAEQSEKLDEYQERDMGMSLDLQMEKNFIGGMKSGRMGSFAPWFLPASTCRTPVRSFHSSQISEGRQATKRFGLWISKFSSNKKWLYTVLAINRRLKRV